MDGRSDGEDVGDFDGVIVGVSVSGSVGSTMVGDEVGLSLKGKKKRFRSVYFLNEFEQN